MMIRHIIDNDYNNNPQPRLDLYYDGVTSTGASRNEPPLFDDYNTNTYINPNKISDYDLVSQKILNKPVHNMSYEELVEVVNAKKNELNKVDTEILSDIKKEKKLSTSEIIPPINLNGKTINEKEIYDKIMKDYENELKDYQENEKKIEKNDSEEVNNSFSIKNFFKKMFNL